jgi:uncharacterized repeat protein (TIGR03803 family)
MRPHFRVTRATRAAAWALFLSIACIDSAGSSYKALHNFNYAEHYQIGPPGFPLFLGARGTLYGTTGAGGVGCYPFGCGVVFAVIPENGGGWHFGVVYEFTGDSDGGDPWGGLISDSSGNLYGTTLGASLTPSTVFELSPSSRGWIHTVIYSNGAGPGLLVDKVGNLYGPIGGGNYFGIGAIGELSPGSDGWVYTDLANFNPTVGYSPPAPPIWDGKGNLFGTTTDGGISQPACWTSNGCGVIFEMTPNGDGTWTYHILHRFASYATDGQTPYGSLVMDASGNFYGTTEFGGSKGNGTVFKFSFTGGHWKKSVVYDFPDWHDGALPNSTLVLDKAGNLYGIGGGGNQGCGPYTCGVVFKLTRQQNGSWKYRAVHKFSGPDGNFPIGVIVDGKGNIFGTTSNGGTYNAGVAFEITP